MKKNLFILGVAAMMAMFACTPDKKAESKIEVTSVPTELIPIEGTDEAGVAVEFKSNETWTAELDVDEDVAVVTPKTGKSGDKCKVSIVVSENETATDRYITLTLTPKGGKPVAVLLVQASIDHIAVSPEVQNVAKAGGSVTVTVDANVEYKVKDYSDGSYPFQKAVVSDDKKTITVTLQANPSLAPRQSYIKLTGTDSEGNDLVAKAYFVQAGSSTLVWQKSLASFGDVVVAGGIHRLAKIGSSIALSDGAKIHQLNPETGAKTGAIAISAASVASDDAGNYIFASEVPWNDAIKVYCVDPAGNQKLLIDDVNNVYGFNMSNFRVKGNVLADAVICCYADVSNYVKAWEIKEGKVEGKPLCAALGGNTVWSASRNACIIPAGTSFADGFLYIGYDGEYALKHFAKNGDGLTPNVLFSLFADPATEGGNDNYNCISTANWNGSKYVAFAVGQFFSYSDGGSFYLLNNGTNTVDYFNRDVLGVTTTYKGADDGENASSDIMLLEENGKLAVYVVDGLADVVYKLLINN